MRPIMPSPTSPKVCLRYPRSVALRTARSLIPRITAALFGGVRGQEFYSFVDSGARPGTFIVATRTGTFCENGTFVETNTTSGAEGVLPRSDDDDEALCDVN